MTEEPAGGSVGMPPSAVGAGSVGRGRRTPLSAADRPYRAGWRDGRLDRGRSSGTGGARRGRWNGPVDPRGPAASDWSGEAGGISLRGELSSLRSQDYRRGVWGTHRVVRGASLFNENLHLKVGTQDPSRTLRVTSGGALPTTGLRARSELDGGWHPVAGSRRPMGKGPPRPPRVRLR